MTPHDLKPDVLSTSDAASPLGDHRPEAAPAVLAIDIGGSHVKIRTQAVEEERRVESGPTMTAAEMVAAVKSLADGWHYDVVSIGYPGPVHDNRPSRDPAHLGPGWAGHDFAQSFGRPVKVVNDALMQAIGSYRGGRMLFLGLGTGLGMALILEGVCHPLEAGHLPYRKGRSFEDYVSEAAREARGKKKWRDAVADVAQRLDAAFLPDEVVIGGGNVEHLKTLPPRCRRGDNALAFLGGFRLWTEPKLVL
ncbi:ROK family protein [Rhizobium rhizosphaerae]|uniref:ROK family protein n=1 Tax=Xaviernesmea rhizosphaerae TaxID=1672749 RepID=UPI00098FA439|nr:ROK family protein [Xaviernesmea rhizosphaerae]